MAEIRYTVAATFPDDATAERWLAWLRGGHVADVMSGGATAAEIVKVDGDTREYEVVYRFPAREAFDRYIRVFAPALRAEGLKLFPPESGVTYRRQVAEVVSS
jgi:hypothetical protein